MIRAIAQTIRTIATTVFVATILLIAAIIAAITVMVYGCSIALWPPQQRPATGLTQLLLSRFARRDVD